MKKLLYILLSLILLSSTVSCQSYNEPISVTETFHGCEFTITLDRGKYDLGDTVKATVCLTNKSGEDVMLYSPSSAPYFTILFTENDKIKLHEPFGVQTVVCYEPVPNNDEYSLTKEFDLDSPAGTEALIKEDSEWKIKATGTIIINEDGENKHEKISLEIIVPH